MSTIKILIVDDHPVFREGLRTVLEEEKDFQIVAEAATVAEALDAVRRHNPQIAIVDISLPDGNGHDFLHAVKREKLPVRVLLLTAYDDLFQRQAAFREGAAAYCVKDSPPEQLVRAIRAVAQGYYWQNGQPANMIADDGFEYGGAASVHPLSAREMEVLKLLARGQSNKEIAQRLNISQQTVKNHIASIFRKLQVRDRTQAALYALKQGWVRLDSAPGSKRMEE